MFPVICLPQQVDTLSAKRKNAVTQYFTSSNFLNSDSLININSSLDNFQTYLTLNTLGNNGLANADLFYNNTNELGFNYSRNNFSHYFFAHNNLKFYNSRTPFSDIMFVGGSKKETFFKTTFSYNVKKNWNITLDFKRIRSNGIYLRQKTNNNFVALSTNYKTKNNRYGLLASIVYNGIKTEDNGGITYDSIFENAGTQDRKLIPVNLSSAETQIDNRAVCLQQYINFGKHSNDTALQNSVIPSSQLIFTSLFEDNAIKYTDAIPTGDFYSHIYFDSTMSEDTTYFCKLSNELEWKRVDNGKHRGLRDKLGVSVFAKNELNILKQIDSAELYCFTSPCNQNLTLLYNFYNIIAGLNLYNNYSNHQLWWRVGGKYVVDGFNKNDYNVFGVIEKNLADTLISLTLNAEIKQALPDYMFNHFHSNHFYWNNNFTQTSTSTFGFSAEIKKYKFAVGAHYRVFKDVCYFDNYAIAQQYKGEIPLLSAFIKKDFALYNWHLNINATYQYVPDSVVIRVPQFVTNSSIYYENELFKKALRLQVGASVNYSTSYFADGYMPATGQFYLQDEKKYGNYPFINFFVNAKIKSARIFFKVEHLNSGWFGNEYMLTPHYPLNDRLFKLGISWRFWD